jgi:hypothetical protein
MKIRQHIPDVLQLKPYVLNGRLARMNRDWSGHVLETVERNFELITTRRHAAKFVFT